MGGEKKMGARAIIFGLILTLSLALPTGAEARPKVTKKIKKSPPASQPQPTILNMIPVAKARLTKASIGTNKIGGDNCVLAVWRKSESEDVKLVRVAKGISKTKGFEVELIRKNGVNSEYKVLKPEGYIVLALKTNATKHGGRRGASEPAIYVPYSKGLHTPEMVAAGRAYLEEMVKAAAEKLNRQNVKSAFDKRYFASDTASPRIMASLFLIEHIDPDEFKELGVKHVAEKVLVILAGNRGEAYRHAVSYAGASGLAQFIAKTYKFIRREYSDAKLKTDFIAGMRDHLNAIMAAYCLADWSVGKFPLDLAHRMTWKVPEETLGAFIAAAYNGGENRAVAAYIADPKNWEKPDHGLAGQTVIYVREFHAVYRYLFPKK